MTLTSPFEIEVPTGACPVCGHATDLMRGRIDRHRQRRIKAAVGPDGVVTAVEYAAPQWCDGRGELPEVPR